MLGSHLSLASLVPDTSCHEVILEKDWIEFVLRTHYHIENRDEDSKARANHAHKQQRLRLELLLRIAEDDQFEEHVGRQLREVLCPERHIAHQLAKRDGPSLNVERVVDAEGVKNGGNEHVLSDEGCEAGALQVRLVQTVALRLLAQQVRQHGQREDQVQGGKRSADAHPDHELACTAHDYDDEEDVQEGVSAGDSAHQQLYEVPLIERNHTLVGYLFLDPEHSDNFPDTLEDQVCTVHIEKPDLKGFLALVNDRKLRQNEHDCVVDSRPHVKLTLDARHQLLLEPMNRVSVVLEAECFVLVMNQRLPAPDWEDHLLPARDVMMVMFLIFLFHFLHDLHLIEAFFAKLLVPLHLIDIFLLVKRVFNLQKRLVVLQETEEHFVLWVLDRIILDIKLL